MIWRRLESRYGPLEHGYPVNDRAVHVGEHDRRSRPQHRGQEREGGIDCFRSEVVGYPLPQHQGRRARLEPGVGELRRRIVGPEYHRHESDLARCCADATLHDVPLGPLRPGVGYGGHWGIFVSAPIRDAMRAGLKNSGTGRAPANMLANSSIAFWLPAIAASSCCICGGGGTARSAS